MTAEKNRVAVIATEHQCDTLTPLLVGSCVDLLNSSGNTNGHKYDVVFITDQARWHVKSVLKEDSMQDVAEQLLNPGGRFVII